MLYFKVKEIDAKLRVTSMTLLAVVSPRIEHSKARSQCTEVLAEPGDLASHSAWAANLLSDKQMIAPELGLHFSQCATKT